MAWQIQAREVVIAWAQQSENVDAMFAILLWLERLAANGPDPSDDAIGEHGRVHLESAVLISYNVIPGAISAVRISSVIEAI